MNSSNTHLTEKVSLESHQFDSTDFGIEKMHDVGLIVVVDCVCVQGMVKRELHHIFSGFFQRFIFGYGLDIKSVFIEPHFRSGFCRTETLHRIDSARFASYKIFYNRIKLPEP